jgi:GxxExxY protein
MRMIHHGDHEDENGLDSTKLIHADITSQILDAAIKVHRALGLGLIETAYEICLFHELTSRGLNAIRHVDLPIRYNDVVLESGYRIDLVVDDAVIVEIKSVDKLASIHDAQLLSYLKLSKKRVGLLINFNVQVLMNGVRRKVL